MKLLTIAFILFATAAHAQTSAAYQDCRKPGIFHWFFCGDKSRIDTLTISRKGVPVYKSRVRIFGHKNEIVIDGRKLEAGEYTIAVNNKSQVIVKQ